MASTRNLVTTEPQGRSYGGEIPFDDIPSALNINTAAITRIIVGHDSNFIRSLTVHYASEQGIKRGGLEGTQTQVVLEPGEFITTVEGTISGNALGKLRFMTNKGKTWGPYADASHATSFTWNATTMVSAGLAPRMGLLYFSGDADSYIRRLKATFAIYTTNEQPPTVVKYESISTPPGTIAPPVMSTFAENLKSPIVQLLVGLDNVEFHAYEAILCRLPFFSAALQGEFRESAEKKITMVEDDPGAVAALIEFLYTGSYTYAYRTTPMDAKDAPACDLAEGSFHVGVYSVAFKYDCQQLVDAAVRSFMYVLKQLAGMDVIKLWETAYVKGLVLSEWENDGGLGEFKGGLAALLKGVYGTHREEMEAMVAEYPALASDFLRLVVTGGGV